MDNTTALIIQSLVSIVSVVITAILAHILSKRRENKIKTYEARKKIYIEFVELTFEIANLVNSKDKDKAQKLSNEKLPPLITKIAVIGSKELYDLYLFFQWISRKTDELEHNGLCNKYARMFVVSEIFQTIRKELAFDKSWEQIDNIDILSAFVTDARTNPDVKKEFELYNKNKTKLKDRYLEWRQETSPNSNNFI